MSETAKEITFVYNGALSFYARDIAFDPEYHH